MESFVECRNPNTEKSFSRMINKLTLVGNIDFSNRVLKCDITLPWR